MEYYLLGTFIGLFLVPPLIWALNKIEEKYNIYAAVYFGLFVTAIPMFILFAYGFKE